MDVGEEDGQPKKLRTIVSGLVRYVPKDYIEGRAVIVVGNMKPSKLRGVLSEGMLLCAMEKEVDGQVTKVGLLEPAEGSKSGDKVTFEGYTDEGTTNWRSGTTMFSDLHYVVLKVLNAFNGRQ